jgi:hypothetical protein
MRVALVSYDDDEVAIPYSDGDTVADIPRLLDPAWVAKHNPTRSRFIVKDGATKEEVPESTPMAVLATMRTGKWQFMPTMTDEVKQEEHRRIVEELKRKRLAKEEAERAAQIARDEARRARRVAIDQDVRHTRGLYSGQVLGRGVFGCAVSPAMPCSSGKDKDMLNDLVRTKGGAYVSKLFASSDSANEEMDLPLLPVIRALDPDGSFTSVPLGTCNTLLSSEEADVLRGCGDMVEGLLWETEDGTAQVVSLNAGTTLNRIPRVSKAVLMSMATVVTGLVALAQARVAHMDVKDDNVAYDGTRCRLIDWGLAQQFHQVFHHVATAVHYPPECDLVTLQATAWDADSIAFAYPEDKQAMLDVRNRAKKVVDDAMRSRAPVKRGYLYEIGEPYGLQPEFPVLGACRTLLRKHVAGKTGCTFPFTLEEDMAGMRDMIAVTKRFTDKGDTRGVKASDVVGALYAHKFDLYSTALVIWRSSCTADDLSPAEAEKLTRWIRATLCVNAAVRLDPAAAATAYVNVWDATVSVDRFRRSCDDAQAAAYKKTLATRVFRVAARRLSK